MLCRPSALFDSSTVKSHCVYGRLLRDQDSDTGRQLAQRDPMPRLVVASWWLDHLHEKVLSSAQHCAASSSDSVLEHHQPLPGLAVASACWSSTICCFKLSSAFQRGGPLSFHPGPTAYCQACSYTGQLCKECGHLLLIPDHHQGVSAIWCCWLQCGLKCMGVCM